MNFKELDSMLILKERCESLPFVDVQKETEIEFKNKCYPIYSFHLGNQNKNSPCLLLTGGLHGLEKIGTHILLSYLDSIIQLSRWDQSLSDCFKNFKLSVVPIVNPVGMSLNRRSNGNHVDLMRNAPVKADAKKTFLVGGQTYSRRLPWYQGRELEPENKAVQSLVRKTIETSPFTIALDLHSGFGLKDRIWFPYAHSLRPFENSHYIFMLKKILDNSYPNNVYVIEPQTKHYVTNGDLWDYLFLQYGQDQNRVFLPLTLEIGSWSWIKKNPRQLLRIVGLYNPMLPHRQKRAIRRHVWLIEFLRRIAYSYQSWAIQDAGKLDEMRQKSHDLWYSR